MAIQTKKLFSGIGAGLVDTNNVNLDLAENPVVNVVDESRQQTAQALSFNYKKPVNNNCLEYLALGCLEVQGESDSELDNLLKNVANIIYMSEKEDEIIKDNLEDAFGEKQYEEPYEICLHFSMKQTDYVHKFVQAALDLKEKPDKELKLKPYMYA